MRSAGDCIPKELDNMRLNNIGVGILIAACGAAFIAIGMVVQTRLINNETDKPIDYSSQSSSQIEEKWVLVPDADMSAGDINSDGVVNTQDYSVLLAYLRNPKSVSINTVNSDYNQDGAIDEDDLDILAALLVKGRSRG